MNDSAAFNLAIFRGATERTAEVFASYIATNGYPLDGSIQAVRRVHPVHRG